jgi:hypothetical protein
MLTFCPTYLTVFPFISQSGMDPQGAFVLYHKSLQTYDLT